MSDEATTPTQGSFDELLTEIGADLNKALPKDPKDGDTAEDDKNIAEAAGDADTNPHAEDDDEAPGEMKKSFTIKLESGEEIEAVDGAELIKSLTARVEKSEAGVGALLREVTKVAVAQGEMIKSLRDDVAKLADAGKGRKAVVSVAEKPAPKAEELTKSDAGQISGEEFMAKALSAQTAGRLTSVQVATAEAYINAGQVPPRDIVAAVMTDA